MTDVSNTPTKPKLKPANENPWYVLATLHGELGKNDQLWKYDSLTQIKNRDSWNELFLKNKLKETKYLFNLQLIARGINIDFPIQNEIINDIDLTYTIFDKSLILNGYHFTKNIRFQESIFNQNIGLENSVIENYCGFTNTKINSWIRFRDANFKRTPPAFQGAIIHESIDFDGVIWPKYIPDANSSKMHLRNYQRLKQEMERLKKYEEELNFFALEMRAKRVIDGKWSPAGIVNAAYDWLSGYGRSVLRPFWLLLVSMLLGVIVENTTKTNGALSSTAEAYGLSLANTFAMLPFVKDAVVRADISTLTSVIGVLQGSIGALMLFLIGLALRNKFRLK